MLVLIVLGFSMTLYGGDIEQVPGINEKIKESIVKIYTVSKSPDFTRPWNSSIYRMSGSGAVIEGGRILTNAHVVANSTFIEVRRYGETKRYQAKVVAVSHQADLAIITVEDKHFFKDIAPLTFGDLPKIEQKVAVFGYPTGGNTLSITTGVVSRIEHHRYVHSNEKFLAIQVDAAINPGNSGGPAISDGKIVGVVMQSRNRAQNIGYLVPTMVIEHFLTDISDGHYDGFAHTGLTIEKLENPTLRRLYNLDDNTTGELVVDWVYNSPAKEVFKKDDIITAVDGHNIENDGTVEFRYHEYTSWKYYIDLHQMGEAVVFDVIRDGKKIQVALPLKKRVDDMLLVKTKRYDTMPTYFIYGGYVFTKLTANLLASLGSSALELRYLATQMPTQERKEIVILLKVLASKLSVGNYNVRLWVIDTLNGQTFPDFTTFYKRITHSDAPITVLADKEGVKLAIDNVEAKKYNDEILKRYAIAKAKSEDLEGR
jgi:S1-C subfamily serine protease